MNEFYFVLFTSCTTFAAFNKETGKAMNAIELEVQKKGLVRAILGEQDENVINKLWMILKHHNPSVTLPETDNERRKIGLLEGKATFREVGNGKISIEEFLCLQDI